MQKLVLVAMLLVSSQVALPSKSAELEDTSELMLREDSSTVGRSTAIDSGLNDCMAKPPILTSELSVQVYLLAPIGGGLVPASDHEVTVRSRRHQRSVKADSRGFARFPALKPGEYSVHVEGAMSSSMRVRVTGRSLGPTGTIAVVANMGCGGLACIVTSPPGPFADPPPCLFLRRP